MVVMLRFVLDVLLFKGGGGVALSLEEQPLMLLERLCLKGSLLTPTSTDGMPDRVVFLEQDVPSSAELLLFERKLSNREVCSVRASNWRSERDAHGAACFRTHHGQSQHCAFLKLREMMADPKQSE